MSKRRSTLPAVGARRDDNEGLIVNTLRAAGVYVKIISGPGLPDLLCGLRGRWHVLEVKGELGPRGGSSGRRLRKNQEPFHLIARQFNLPCAVVRTPEEALQALGLLRATITIEGRAFDPEAVGPYPFDLSDSKEDPSC